MSISNELFLAILSMDSYNQGYGRGIEHGKTKIGSATATPRDQHTSDIEYAAWQAAGFYAVSYDTPDYGTVISYRGTDNFSWPNADQGGNDVVNGWTTALGNVSEGYQADLALKFYSAVTGRTYDEGAAENTILTGHSFCGDDGFLVTDLDLNGQYDYSTEILGAPGVSGFAQRTAANDNNKCIERRAA